MIQNRPVVTGNTLHYREQGHEQIVPVGTPTWYAWLRTARAFTFCSSSGQFTVRCERASNGRGGWYWKAYYRRAGKLCSAYLGKSERLSLERLQEVAAGLTGSGARPDRLAVPGAGANPLPVDSSPTRESSAPGNAGRPGSRAVTPGTHRRHKERGPPTLPGPPPVATHHADRARAGGAGDLCPLAAPRGTPADPHRSRRAWAKRAWPWLLLRLCAPTSPTASALCRWLP